MFYFLFTFCSIYLMPMGFDQLVHCLALQCYSTGHVLCTTQLSNNVDCGLSCAGYVLYVVTLQMQVLCKTFRYFVQCFIKMSTCSMPVNRQTNVRLLCYARPLHCHHTSTQLHSTACTVVPISQQLSRLQLLGIARTWLANA